MAGAPRPVLCQIRAEKPAMPADFSKMGVKIVLQPRVCTLRSFGGERGVIRLQGNTNNNTNRENQVSQFFEILTDYVESSKKSHDFEIISGRLAMIVFAATVGVEIMTGNSVFGKMDLQGIEEGAGFALRPSQAPPFSPGFRATATGWAVSLPSAAIPSSMPSLTKSSTACFTTPTGLNEI